MAEIRVAGNYINGTAYLGQNYGHLQLVFVGDDGSETEIEVQAPDNFLSIPFGGNWVFEGLRDHKTNTPNYGDQKKYAYTTLDFSSTGQTVEDVWALLVQAHDDFSTSTNEFEYDRTYNSNTYVNTLLWILGLNGNDLISQVSAPDITQGFPGDHRNALMDTEYPDDAIDLALDGQERVDIIRTGNGKDTLSGGAGKDVLEGGNNDDTLYAGMKSTTLADWDDDVADRLNGGNGNDTYFVGARTSDPNHYLIVNGAFNTGIYEHIDIITDTDGQGVIRASVNPFDDGYFELLLTGLTWTSEDYIVGVDDWRSDDYARAALDTTNGLNRLILYEPELESAIFAIDDFRNGDFGITLPNYTGSTGPRKCSFCIDGEHIGTSGNDSIDGGIGDDIFNSGDGDDTITAGAGDDTIIGGSGLGDDSYDGGAGTDEIVYSSASLAITVNLSTGSASGTEIGTDTLISIEDVIGGEGSDTITGSTAANYIFGGLGDDTITGGDGDDVLTGAEGADSLDGEAGSDSLSGKEGADTLNGGSGQDVLEGGAGNDTLSGGDDDDVLDGGAGSDSLDGGGGSDTASYGAAGAAVTANLANSVVNTGDASGDTYTSIEHLAGSLFADDLTGTSAANNLYGLDGDDTLRGGAGDDVLSGGLGADVLIGGDGTDTASYEFAGDGVTASLVNAAGNLGAANGDTYTGIENLTGSGFGDVLVGDGSANVLNGLDGDDTLEGGAGADQLSGGDGTDMASYAQAAAAVTVHLGDTAQNAGDALGDTYISIEGLIGSAFGDTLILVDDGSIVSGGAGNDSITVVGSGNTVSGGDGNDAIYGGIGTDIINGDAGDDTAIGEAGDDQIDLGGGDDYAVGGAGNDTILGGAEADELHGSAGNDSLVGGDGDDLLYGDDGNDTIEMGAGNDFTIGGLGDDTFVFDGIVGSNFISDFDAGAGVGDVIEISNVPGVTNFTELQSLLSEFGGNTFIDVDANNYITLEGVSISQLNQDDFVFI